jgi:hypothetical protein
VTLAANVWPSSMPRRWPDSASATTRFCRGSAQAGWAKFTWPKTSNSRARWRSNFCRPR